MAPQSIRDHLQRAYERARDRDPAYTYDHLAQRARLPLTRTTIARKLSGQLPMSVDEAVALAGALGVRLVATTRRAR